MSVLERFIDLYAPHTCVSCGLEGAVICVTCLCAVPRALARCYRCHVPSRHGQTCENCLSYGLRSIVSAVSYQGAAQDAVWQLKFGRARAAADVMARPMALVGRHLLPPSALIVPAPTASSRTRARGYDQAAELSRAIADQTGTPVAALLWRLGQQRQVGADRLQRRQQMQGAFHVRDPRQVIGRHIVLIDDVVTTGSTLEAAAQALMAAGAASVSAITFAQA